MQGLESGMVKPAPLLGKVKEWVEKNWQQRVEAFNSGKIDDIPLPSLSKEDVDEE